MPGILLGMQLSARKPARLCVGDTVAVLSPSWGGPSVFPHIHEAGLRVLHERFGLKVREWPTTRASAALLAKEPLARAREFQEALLSPEVKAVITSIGGDDSMRLLPHLNPEMLRQAMPKVVMGYSDATTLLTWLHLQGWVTFHGPSVMAGLAQAPSLPDSFTAHVRALLFEPADTYEYRPYDTWTERYLDWNEPSHGAGVAPLRPNPTGFRFLQGRGRIEGPLFGGCIEVLEFLKGTRFWPAADFWNGRILFLETSEEKPTPTQVLRMLRNYALQGVLDRISGLLFGRARDYSEAEKRTLEQLLVQVVSEELGRPDLPIVADMDFGHTDPQLILPLGIRAEVDCQQQRIRLLEPPVL